MPPICSAQVATIRSATSGSVTSPARYSPPQPSAASHQRVGVAADEEHLRALGAQAAPDLEADAAARAGHHAHLAVEPEIHGPIVTAITPPSRDVAHGRALDGRAVGAAEQRGVHEQREQLPERHALARGRRPAARPRRRRRRRAPTARRRAAAWPGRPRGGRRRRPGRSAARARRRRPGRCRPTGRRAGARAARAGPARSPIRSHTRSTARAPDALSVPRSRHSATSGCQAALARRTTASRRAGSLGSESSPMRSGATRAGRRRRARRRRAEVGRSGGVQRGQPAPERLLAGGVQAPRVDPLERQEARPVAVADRQHPGQRDRVGLRQPAQPGGLGGVLARRGVGARLDEGAPAAGQLERPRLVDRAARRARAAGHLGAGGARHRVGQRRAGRSRGARGADLVEQPPARRLDQVEHAVEAVRAAVVGVGDVEVARGDRRRGRTRAAAAPWRAPASSGARASSSRSLSRSIASRRSKRSKSSAVTWRAAPSTTMSRDRAAATARVVGRSARVPAAGAGAVDLDGVARGPRRAAARA